MQIIAKLTPLISVQTGSGKNGVWKKQDLIVETDGQFPKKICISVWGITLKNVNCKLAIY